ncbi:MAG TPA: hypothetical protein VM791_14345 [Vicinamibacterales bacterium]|nr:hypothetical protein [Vicinamibacterales bacterium]
MRPRHHLIACTILCVVSVMLAQSASPRGATPRFYRDDPMQREPESQDASQVQKWDIDLFWDLAENMFGHPGDPALNQRARNVNSIDEVPDSNWFTNRILARPLTVEEAARGPLTGSGPAPGTWTVIGPKQSGYAPGFTIKDAKGELWFVSFDANGFPDAATGAILVANKIFWALGYWQVENHRIQLNPATLVIADTAMMTTPTGSQRPLTQRDIQAVFRRSQVSDDGTYRAIAARGVSGRTLGGFRYYGTRPDDPNDIIPHEHRRELRALKVFGAWTNLVDMKAGNTLDSLITDSGKGVVRHYLQDVGSTFGTGANAPREYDEGWEYLFEGDLVWKRMVTLGFYLRPWQTVKYVDNPMIGRFEGTEFEPREWKPRVPTAAFLRAGEDDTFWAARRVMAFSDDMIRAIARTGEYGDEAAPALLAQVLIERRNAIGRAYLNAINPIIAPALDAAGTLTFENAAVAAGVAAEPPGGYIVEWAAFDNTTNNTTPIGSPALTNGHRAAAPSSLPSQTGAFVKVGIKAVNAAERSWATPVNAYFRRDAGGWTLVGIERTPAGLLEKKR